MKKLTTNIILILCTLAAHAQYDQNLVTISSVQMGNEKLSYVAMSREGSRIKAKYFAARDGNTGMTVYQRFLEWSKNKKLVAVTSGGYMIPNCDAPDPITTPVGLSIDNGLLVNNNIEYHNLDGLAVVYASDGGGGIAMSNLKIGDLTIQESGKNVSIDLRDGYSVSRRFIPWAESNKVSVFQSHLFVWKNSFLLDPAKASPKLAKRRVLAVGTNPGGQIFHYIIDLPGDERIYDAALKAFNFLQKRAQVNVIFMINLESGCSDTFTLYRADGTVDRQFGYIPILDAVNLLCYYYE